VHGSSLKGKQPIENLFFKRKPGKHFFSQISVGFKKENWLDQDKSFPQQVALISTDGPIKCPIFGETFASIETEIQVDHFLKPSCCFFLLM